MLNLYAFYSMSEVHPLLLACRRYCHRLALAGGDSGVNAMPSAINKGGDTELVSSTVRPRLHPSVVGRRRRCATARPVQPKVYYH